ncbi:MAG: ion channel [Hyphomicrobiales bacterium]
MNGQLLIGSSMIIATTIIHVVGLVSLIAVLRNHLRVAARMNLHLRIMGFIILAIFGIFFMHSVEIWLWAVVYVQLGEFDGFARALYFSTATFTTLGYGDVTLNPAWQLLSSLESANGIILTGVSTAFAFGVVRRAFEMAGVVGSEDASIE